MDKLLVIKHLEVEGANAIAGLTWGFPAITNFLGFTHALQRKIQQTIDEDIVLTGCAVICHSSQVHASNNNLGRETYFSLSRNPLIMKGKEAVTAPFNEEGKMRFDISLLINVKGTIGEDEQDSFDDLLAQQVPKMRVAGGTVIDVESMKLFTDINQINENDQTRKAFLRRLLPGFALVSRDDILQEHIATTQKSPFDAWLDFSQLIKRPTPKSSNDDNNNDTEKQANKATWDIETLPYQGWLKPIAVGYQGISPLYDAGGVGHVRDRSTPVQFVESIYSLGQWISPHRINDIEHLLWTQSYDEDQSLYLCNNAYPSDLLATIANEQHEILEEN